MAIRPVIRMGNPQLLEVSKTVTQFNTPELHSLVADMIDTMRDLKGAGLAAPQIGELLRVVIFGFDENPRYPDAEPVPFTVLVNPKLTPSVMRWTRTGRDAFRFPECGDWCLGILNYVMKALPRMVVPSIGR